MGHIRYALAATLASWKAPLLLMAATACLLPTLQQLSTPPAAALMHNASMPLIDDADSIIIYADPADADPVLHIASRDINGDWHESETQLRHDQPAESAKLMQVAIARETQSATAP